MSAITFASVSSSLLWMDMALLWLEYILVYKIFLWQDLILVDYYGYLVLKYNLDWNYQNFPNLHWDLFWVALMLPHCAGQASWVYKIEVIVLLAAYWLSKYSIFGVSISIFYLFFVKNRLILITIFKHFKYSNKLWI